MGSIVIANVVELVQSAQRLNEDFEKTMDNCERIINLRKLEGPLAVKIRHYFRKYYELEHEKGTRALVDRMSPMLQREVVQNVYADWIEDVPWIAVVSPFVLVKLILVMNNNLYIPEEFIPDLRQTSFVERGIILVGGRVLRKGDSWGIDMTLHGSWRTRCTGTARVFAATLCLTCHDLEMILADHPDDAWAVKKVSTCMAMRRHMQFLAQQVTSAGRLQSSLKQAVEEFKPNAARGHGHHHHQQRDDMGYLIKTINDVQSSNDKRSNRMEQRQEVMDQRLATLESGMQQILGILKGS